MCIHGEWLHNYRKIVVRFALIVRRHDLCSLVELRDMGIYGFTNCSCIGLKNAIALNIQWSGNVVAAACPETEVVGLRYVVPCDEVHERARHACSYSLQSCHQIVLVVVRLEVGEVERATRAQVVHAYHDGQHFPIILYVDKWVLVHLSDQIGDLSAAHINNHRARFRCVVCILVWIIAGRRAICSVTDLCWIGSQGVPNQGGVETFEEVRKGNGSLVSSHAERSTV